MGECTWTWPASSGKCISCLAICLPACMHACTVQPIAHSRLLRRAAPRSLVVPTDPSLGITLRRLVHVAPNHRDLRPEGPADTLTAVLLAVNGCVHPSAAWSAQNAAKALLGKHAAAMVQVVSQLLQQPPEEQLTAAAAAAAAMAGTASSKAAGAWVQAAAGLAELVDVLLVSVSIWARDTSASALLQSSAAAAQSVRALEAALYAVLDGTAACLAWLPASERHSVQRMSSEAVRGFESLFAAARPPAPLPPSQLRPRPQPTPAASRVGSSGGGSQQAMSGDGRRASYAAAAASGAGQRPPPGLVPAGPEPAGGEQADKPTYAEMARGGQAAAERQRRSSAIPAQAQQQKGFWGSAWKIVRDFLSID